MATLDIGKAKKVLSSAFLEQHSNISEDEAAALIVKAEQTVRDLKEEMTNDEKLMAATSIIKDLKGGYTSAIKYEEAKIQFLLAKIDEIVDSAPSSKD